MLPLTDEDEEHHKWGNVPVRLEKLLGLQPGHHITELILQLLSQVSVGHRAVWSQKHTLYCSLSSNTNDLMSHQLFLSRKENCQPQRRQELCNHYSLWCPLQNGFVYRLGTTSYGLWNYGKIVFYKNNKLCTSVVTKRQERNITHTTSVAIVFIIYKLQPLTMTK